MNLSIIISRFSNFLFFVQKNGNFLAAYPSNNPLDLSFYEKNERAIWRQIELSTDKHTAKKIKEAITPLKGEFFSHWNAISGHLLLWKRYFQNNRHLLQQALSETSALCGVKHFAISNIPIYLISDPASDDNEINAWFSWTPKQSFLVVEIPHNLTPPNHLFPVSVLIHEFFHLLIRRNKILFSTIATLAQKDSSLITKIAGGIPNRIFLEELLVSSFIPEGYLSKQYFDTKIPSIKPRPKTLLQWRKFIASNMYQMARTYINSHLAIDKRYLNTIIKIIKQSAV
ncbi:hypothetical protein A2524_02885 [Candidatus Wolfebacteria bacterium RIFOXYD12_FULL_48_21]|uniref:DUF2268 domain-containing protein n=1 Tax=Candidatus Wolfebacteria bacterium RIFOXYD1_FULL_48_65 TaxID=1802561 RepID=A0A1F8E4Q0_9BACT|nr:MAG: hypothetical protein A2610_02275 [Candidatus Wolfebacteria bacterium RIFOXYD1_FULL_48_65]OGM95012.1 MAG: hypothetical protein A2524_02885 [Candidatus Wolfebacteria bacterium RIFOXYD12_FULL_48_21]OGM95850.1 MAG: hypothetical protein A2532_02190 [Candidatus Wolfebacteria bacterium RIFOXYD2_FULL_48_11]